MNNELIQGGINIIGVTTREATINVFIEEKPTQKAQEEINNVFKT